jgi:hypothetical protein
MMMPAMITTAEPFPLIDFKVDYIGHYFPFYVLTPVGSYFQELHYVALAIILFSFATPFIVKSLRKLIGSYQ